MNIVQALKMSCRDATYLHEKKKEGKITLSERLGLWFHLNVVCKFCNFFFRQVDHLEHSAKKYAEVSEQELKLSPDKKEAIQKALNQQQ